MRKGSKRLHPDTPCDDRDLEPEMRKCAVCRYCYIASIGYKEVLNSKIFAWNIDDDEGEEEIYIEIEEQDD